MSFFAKRAPAWVDFLAWFIWIFVIIKLFIIDLDSIVISALAPSQAWLLHYKLVFFIGVVAFVAVTAGRLRLWRWVFCILFFPFIVIFWKLPVNVFKTGSLDSLFFIDFSLFSIVRSIKYASVVAFLLLICAMICAYAESIWLLYTSAVFLMLLLCVIFVAQVLSIVRTSRIYEGVRRAISVAQAQAVEKINAVSDYSELALVPIDENGKLVASNIESAVLTNRVLLLGAKQLRRYQESGIMTLSNLSTLIYMIALTTYIFTFVNMALFKISPSNYESTKIPSTFTFSPSASKRCFSTQSMT